VRRYLAGIFFFAFLIAFCQSVFSQSSWRESRVEGAGDLVAVYFTSATRGWIAGDEGFLASTTDGGKSWTRYPLGTTEDINEIYFRNDKNGYLVAGRKMFATGDAGRTWQEISIFKPGDFRGGTPEFLSIRFADKRRGLIVGSVVSLQDRVVDSVVMRTVDGGDTWQRIFVPYKGELFHLDFNGSARAWIVGDQGTILHTADGGDTWRVQSSGTTMPLYNVDFRDDSEGFAVGKGGVILRTENGGAAWESIESGDDHTYMRVDFADSKNGWVVGYSGSILHSSDRARTWTKQQSGTERHLYGLFMARRYGWAVGENGTLLEFIR
jgi:photosystem II stability/assembly factor-like uncharacterized protein